MSFEKRAPRAASGTADDATEIIPAQSYARYTQQADSDADATTVLPARQEAEPADAPDTVGSEGTPSDLNATVILPTSSLHAPTLAMGDSRPGGSPAADADTDKTVPMPQTQERGRHRSVAGDDATVPFTRPVDAGAHSEPGSDSPSAQQTLATLKSKVSAGTATSLAAAKSSWANTRAKARETADRVKKERAARAAEKANHAPAQQLPPSGYPTGAAYGQHPSPYVRMPAGGVGINPGAQAPSPYGQMPAPGPYQPSGPTAHSGEHSPSGRLHMLTPSHIRQTRPSLWTLIQHFFAAGTLFCLLVISLVFFIMTPTGQQLDEVSFQEFAYQFMTYTEQTSGLLNLIPAAAGITAAVGLLFVLLWKHRFVPALVGLGMALGANLTTQLLKNYLIIKPNLGIQEALGNSAPSGHTTFAAASGLALFLASPKRFRPTVALISTVFTIAAGYSTVINGWHRPADVVSAILVTGLWGVLGLVILRFMRSEELDMSGTQRSGLILVPLLSISGFFVGFCALALYWVTNTNPIPGSAFMAAICLIAAVAALTTSIQVALLRPQNKQRSAYRRVWAY
ncbi:hypothetical protein A7979_09970 [Rothia nasimurium]|uniref:Phosphatidic acid phosphatase type 2/haloperoxidase domain-containing protein n=1 Tax=Rothia nasimurium TaxID=85336 RepID=A0A1Y1RRN1_9MICC|nr:phosphatase PAP2 family protein [Rothia nasimurium]ORC24321.1 hypothetical protein A7979_09970 [Rothia nasimurium]